MTGKSEPWVLGISASHNGAACLLKGDKIVVAIQEERLTRVKRDYIYAAHPSLAISYCLDYAGIQPGDLSLVVNCVTESAKTPDQDVRYNPVLEPINNKIPTLTIPHHYGHAVGVFATSGYTESAVLVVDGAGSPAEDLYEEERRAVKGKVRQGRETVSLYSASGVTLTPLEKHLGDWLVPNSVGMPHFGSLGGMYAAVSQQIFGDKDESGKVMGLAPYGTADISPDEFFDIVEGCFLFHDKVPHRFRHTEHWPLRSEQYKNLASSTQEALEKGLFYLVERLYRLCPSQNLCYAGGVALNSVGNEKIINSRIFNNIYIMPAAEDSGAAVGAAYHGLWQLTGKNNSRKLIHDAVGREYSFPAISKQIDRTPQVVVCDSEDVISDTVDLLCEGKIIGWFQGRSELGPRALGQRSILCDPRRQDGKEVLNGRVKHREAFRPFAPIVLLEEAHNWFEPARGDFESPFMLRVCKFKEEMAGQVPAVVHVDGTGRVQTVTPEANGKLYELVKKFYERTGVPVLLNTSFNVMGEPIVETPEDALNCFISTGLDYCVFEETLVKKREKILFGEDRISWDKVIGEKIAEARQFMTEREAAGAHQQRPLQPVRPLAEYLGAFEHPVYGTIIIGQDKTRLTLASRRYRYELPLTHYSQEIFEANGTPLGGYKAIFVPTKKGDIDCVVVIAPKPSTKEIVFTRAPLNDSRVRPAKEHLTGEYEGEGQTMKVRMGDNGMLLVGIPGQPEFELVETGEDEFNLRKIPGYNLKFHVRQSPASADAVTVWQPNGIFELKKRQ